MSTTAVNPWIRTKSLARSGARRLPLRRPQRPLRRALEAPRRGQGRVGQEPLQAARLGVPYRHRSVGVR